MDSEDLNAIEHIWDLLDWRARAIPHRNVRELTGALVEEWGNISQQELANLVQSMGRRYRLLLLILTPLCLGTYYSISVSHIHVCGTCSVYVSVVESCYVHTNIYTW